MHERRCENCKSSEEIEPYRDKKCPYMVCETGEIVSRWSVCDDWKEQENDRRTEKMDI